MKMVFAGIWIVSLLLGSVVPRDGMAQTQPATAAVPQDQDVQATREQVREIQFMLLRLGLDPGPLDGYPRQLTNGAVRRFEETYGLPLVDLEPGGKVPAAFLTRLRAEACSIFSRHSKYCSTRACRCTSLRAVKPILSAIWRPSSRRSLRLVTARAVEPSKPSFKKVSGV